MAECSDKLRADGKPCPRTCEVCQLGPCTMGPVVSMEALECSEGRWWRNGTSAPVKVFSDTGEQCIIKGLDGILRTVPSSEVSVCGKVYLWDLIATVRNTHTGRTKNYLVLASHRVQAHRALEEKMGRSIDVTVNSRRHVPGVTLAQDYVLVGGANNE